MDAPSTLPSGRTALAGGSGALLDSTIREVHEVLESLKTQPSGLLLDGAEARLARDGPNLLPTPKGPSLARQFGQQLTHGFALMLWVASILAFVAQLPELGWAVAVVVLVNGSFSFLQEYRAERATQALGALLPERARCCVRVANTRSPLMRWSEVTSCCSGKATGCLPTSGPSSPMGSRWTTRV